MLVGTFLVEKNVHQFHYKKLKRLSSGPPTKLSKNGGKSVLEFDFGHLTPTGKGLS